MTTRDDGGPAFGVHHPDIEPGYHGMSLRDWFAGQALAGILANANAHMWEMHTSGIGLSYACLQIADAMIAARGK